MNHIELFAGCGGLSLGLETAGFELLIANELSPMASETFAFNHLNADIAEQNNIEKVIWISSQYSRDEIGSRLRENPSQAIGLGPTRYSDLEHVKNPVRSLKRSLLVGSIADLNTVLEQENNHLLSTLRSGFGDGGVDVVSGGPPCQSFSLAGLRDHTNQRNKLPWEFANFVEKIRPKIALLENVTGILRPFTIEGEKYFAWFEVAKAFAKVGYIPLCLQVNAKHVGAAQNRPRFIMIAIRDDVYSDILKSNLNKDAIELLAPSGEFYREVSKNNVQPKYDSLPCYNLDKHYSQYSETFLHPLVTCSEKHASVESAIDDLRDTSAAESGYVARINSCYLNTHQRAKNKNKNHNYRQNSPKVQARFRLYQVMNNLSKDESKAISNYLKLSGTSELPEQVVSKLKEHWLLTPSGKRLSRPTTKQAIEILDALYTKKQTQRALVAHQPAPAALSIPDDACHYFESEGTLRTLTVREMARIQSFPDWYEIRSKVTTGGQMRKFEVPQYTQIGNAVPPLLGVALGEVCKSLLNMAGHTSRN